MFWNELSASMKAGALKEDVFLKAPTPAPPVVSVPVAPAPDLSIAGLSLVASISSRQYIHLRSNAVSESCQYHQLAVVSRDFTMGNEMQRAICALLATPPTHHDYIPNALTACVMAAGTPSFHSTVSVVAGADGMPELTAFYRKYVRK